VFLDEYRIGSSFEAPYNWIEQGPEGFVYIEQRRKTFSLMLGVTMNKVITV
jgi:hypothetical protein